MAKEKFKLGIEDFDSTPTLEPPEIIRVRATDLAQAVEAARQQGYIEANVAGKVLDLIKEAVRLIF